MRGTTPIDGYAGRPAEGTATAPELARALVRSRDGFGRPVPRPADLPSAVAARLRRLLRRDPRDLQIAVLGTLWLVTWIQLDFGPTLSESLVVWASCLSTEAFLRTIARSGSGARRPGWDFRSPMITGLSLTLLLRVDHVGFYVLAAVLAIASKYAVRLRARHLWNPANAGIVLVVWLGGGWISPGQWGSWVVWAGALACAGLLVCLRASRLDLAITFLSSYGAIAITRALLLRDPLAIPMRDLTSGTLVLFTFFMITDPRTTPDRRCLRLVLGVALAISASLLRYDWFLPNAFVYSLFVLAPLSRALDEGLTAVETMGRPDPPRLVTPAEIPKTT